MSYWDPADVNETGCDGKDCFRPFEFVLDVPATLRKPGQGEQLFLCDSHAQLQEEDWANEMQAREQQWDDFHDYMRREDYATSQREAAAI
jgi:hypothetical protein